MQKNINSTAKGNLVLIWFVTIVLGFMSYFVVTRGYAQSHTIGVDLILSILPMLAFLFLYLAITDTKKWLKYGKTPLMLDPLVPRVGEELGGTISLNTLYRSKDTFKVILTNVYRYETREWDSHRGRYDVHIHHETFWQEEGYAKVVNHKGKSHLEFLFELPNNLKATSHDYFWKLEVQEESGSKKFYRQFIVDVEEAWEQSDVSVEKNLSSQKKRVDSSKYLPDGVEEMSAFTLLPLIKDANNYRIDYPAYYHKLGLQGVGLFMSIFLLLGLGMLIFGDFGMATFVGSMFTLVGLFFISFGFYDFVIKMEILIEPKSVVQKKYFMGKMIKETTILLEEPIVLEFRDIFRQPLTKENEGFPFLLLKQNKKEIYLAKYIESLKAQKVLMKFFRELWKEQIEKGDKK